MDTNATKKKAPSEGRAITWLGGVVPNLDKVLTPFVTSQRGNFQFSEGKKTRLTIDVFLEFGGVRELEPALKMI